MDIHKIVYKLLQSTALPLSYRKYLVLFIPFIFINKSLSPNYENNYFIIKIRLILIVYYYTIIVIFSHIVNIITLFIVIVISMYIIYLANTTFSHFYIFFHKKYLRFENGHFYFVHFWNFKKVLKKKVKKMTFFRN